MKHVPILIASLAGMYAALSWTAGDLHPAGIAAAISAAAVVWWGFLRYCEEQACLDELIRAERETVWARRDFLTESLIDDFGGTWPDERHLR